MIPAMTKNVEMCKNSGCPKGWIIKQQSALLNLLRQCDTVLASLCLASYYFIIQQVQIQFSDKLLGQWKGKQFRQKQVNY